MKILKSDAGELLLDDEDYERVSSLNWYRNRYFGRGVIQNSRNGNTISIGRYILNYNGPLEVDHKDKNPLNNQKENLRIATRSQQMMNSSPRGLRDYKGVHKIKDMKLKKKFRSIIKVNGKNIHLGYFLTDIEAAKAYDGAAKKYFKEFAFLNFPEDKS